MDKEGLRLEQKRILGGKYKLVCVGDLTRDQDQNQRDEMSALLSGFYSALFARPCRFERGYHVRTAAPKKALQQGVDLRKQRRFRRSVSQFVKREEQQVKGEQSIVVKTKEGKVVLTNSDEIGLKEWVLSLRSAHKSSVEMLCKMARKAGRIYGTDLESTNSTKSANGN